MIKKKSGLPRKRGPEAAKEGHKEKDGKIVMDLYDSFTPQETNGTNPACQQNRERKSRYPQQLGVSTKKSRDQKSSSLKALDETSGVDIAQHVMEEQLKDVKEQAKEGAMNFKEDRKGGPAENNFYSAFRKLFLPHIGHGQPPIQQHMAKGK